MILQAEDRPPSEDGQVPGRRGRLVRPLTGPRTVNARLAARITPRTLNAELSYVLGWLGFLAESYCGQRLGEYYSKRCGVHITPHQLRHSCATLLLNAGAPIITVQTILGHRHIETTLGYARLYDGTIAADYYRAMAQVEQRMALPETTPTQPPTHGELLALVDSLRRGTLNKTQAETVNALRVGLTAMAEQAAKGKQG